MAGLHEFKLKHKFELSKWLVVLHSLERVDAGTISMAQRFAFWPLNKEVLDLIPDGSNLGNELL